MTFRSVFLGAVNYHINFDDRPPNPAYLPDDIMIAKYSASDNVVSGELSVVFNKKVDRIKEIRYEIKCNVSYDYLLTENSTPKNCIPHKESISLDNELFHVRNSLPLSEIGFSEYTPQTGTYCYKAGTVVSHPFSIGFPSSRFIPSSCRSFGTKKKGSLNINYTLIISVMRLGKSNASDLNTYSTYEQPLFYQAGFDTSMPQGTEIITRRHKHIFERKPMFLHARFKRDQLVFDGPKYSGGITKRDIPLELELNVKPVIQLNDNLASHFHLKLISDLASVNINSNRSEAFIREGKSTMLGLFQIKKLKIYQSNRVSIQRGEYTIKDTVLKEILMTEFDNLYVDLIDFNFDTEEGYYSKVISSEDLADASKKDLDASVFSWDDYMSLMTTGFSIQWFENITNLIFEWTISNGDEMESVYTFETPSTFDCAKAVPGCSESLKLEKEWRREEADIYMHTNASSTTITGKATNDELFTSKKIDEMISEIVNQRVDQALAASRHSDTSVKSSIDVDEIIAMVNSTLQFQPEITEPTFAPPSYDESEGRFFRELQEDKEDA
jgi:hypothetical protein